MLSNSRKKEGPPNDWGLLLVNCLTPDMPVVSDIRASSLKSSVWRGVVLVALVVGMMVMFASNQARADKVYEYFAGTTNVPNATVQINGTKGTTNSDGSFGFHAERDDQYAISVSKPGYALASIIKQWPSRSLIFTLKQADVISISVNDHANGIIVADSRDTQIELPANAFGDSVNEPINAYVYTYDLGNEPMPGDMTVSGSDGYLVSAGVFSAEFVGVNSGNKYNLAAGKEAIISVPTSINGDLPELWYYDEATGKWVEEGSDSVEVVDGRLQGKVSHFTLWNFDWYKSDPACIEVTLEKSLFESYGVASGGGSPLSVTIRAKVESSSPVGTVTYDKTWTGYAYPIIFGIGNIPPNSKADIYVKDHTTGVFVLFDKAVDAGNGLGHPINWNSFDSNECKGSTTLTGSPNIPIVPGFAKIVGKGKGVSFSWLLKDKSGTTIANNPNAPSSITSPVGSSSQMIAAKFASDINNKTNFNPFFSTNSNKIELGNHILFVGKVGLGNTPADIAQMCQVNFSSPCAFNPDIQLVTKKQVLTTLDGFLWNDVNENGLRDIGEEYRQGWTVTLNSGKSVLTDANGYYEFTGLSQGNYTLTVETRTGVVYTTNQSLARAIGDVNDPAAEIPAAANFGIKDAPQFTLTVNQTGNGNGTVSGDGSFATDTTVNLTATPNTGSTFDGWQPAPCASSFGMPANNLTCTATFSKVKPIVTLKPTSIPSKICKGQGFDITFSVETTKTIGAMQAKLNFDSSLGSFPNVQATSLITGGSVIPPVMGQITFAAWWSASSGMKPPIDIPVGTTPLFKVTNLIPTTVGTLNFDFDSSQTWSKNVVEIDGLGLYEAGKPDPLTQTNQSLQLTVEDCGGNGGTDNDADGVADSIEDSAPNGGDGNGDGTPDSQQTNVTSLPSVVTGDYVSLETTDTNCPVQAVKSKSETDAGNGQDDPLGIYPQGLLEFDIPCDTANIKMFYHGVPVNSANNTINIGGINFSISLLGYRKFGPNPPGSSTEAWYTLEPKNGFDPNLQFGTATIDGNTILTASFTLQDGELGDDTGVDGIIYDDGGFTSNWDGTIEGHKFIDSQINGTQGIFDENDESLPTETIYLNLEGSSSRPSSRKTGDDGKYSFGQKNAGTYRVWQRSNPNSDEWTSYDKARIVVIAEDGGITVDDETVFSVDFPILGLTQADKDTVNTVKTDLAKQCNDATTKSNFNNAGVTDIVKIDTDLTITSSVTVKGICNNATLTVDGDNVWISATDFIANYGSIVGKDGKSSSDNLPNFNIPNKNPADSNDNKGGIGTKVDIAVGTDDNGFCAEKLQGTFYNEGLIQAGQGGSGYLIGGNGGEIKISCAKTIIQSGEIIAGNGGEANGHQPAWDSWGMNELSLWDGDVSLLSSDFTNNTTNYANISVTSGNGGQVFISTGENENDTRDGQELIATPTSKTISGEGGLAGIWCSTNPLQSNSNCQLENWNDDDPRWPTGDCKCEGVGVAATNPGDGGDLNVYSKNLLRLQGKAIAGGSLYFEPSLMVSGKDTHIEAKEDVVIFGGENWELILTGLSEGAINAGRDIVLAVGEGGTIDLRGVSPKAFKAVGKFEIHANTVLLDDGVQLENLIEAQEIVVGPNKIIYHVVLSGHQQTEGQPNTTVPISLTIANGGPSEDTYTLKAVSKSGWNVSGLPSSVSIKGLNDKQLALSLVLPAEGSDTITITATSQADPTVIATARIIATVAQETTAKFSISTTSGVTPLTVDLDASASVANGSIVSYKWTASDGQTVEGQNAQLTFTEAGDYVISLEVTDDKGATNLVSSNVSVIMPIVYAIQGTILDDLNNPIEGVTLQIGDKTVVTDALGNWEIQGLHEGVYTITATKDGLTFMPQDFEVGNNQLWTQLTLKPLSQLKVRITPKTRGKKAEQGKNFGYRIDVTNGGNQVATGGTLIYQIPAGTTLVELNGIGKVTCEATVETVTCNIPDLPIGATAKVDIVLNIGVTASTLLNVVTLNSNEYPVDIAKNWTKAKPYLSVFGKAKPSPVQMGGILHYEFDVELNDNAPNGKSEGTTLTITLPKGLKLEAAPANCDTSNLPVISCPIADLSVETPEDTSKSTINLDVLAEEMGIIKLITKAEITSDNYAAHASKVRVEVDTRGVEVDGVIVMDITNSMGDQLNAIIRQVKQRLVDGFADGATPLIAVVTFRDEDDIKLVAATRNLTTLLEAVESLEAKDGGMCPEASADALLLGLSHLKQKGTLIFVTDAPPYDDAETQANLEQIKQLLIDKEINRIPIMAEVNCDGGN